jgi:hypothetical protein
MSFLAPLFLLGSLAVALPVIFHLMRRHVRERVVFSSHLFLKPSPPRISKRSRFEHLWLLLLRALVISLVALAFARPYWERNVPAPVTPPPDQWTVLLLDTSASMRRDGLWAGAVEQAGQWFARMAPRDQMSVLAFDQQVHAVVSFQAWTEWAPESRAALAQQRLAALSPSWRSTDLGAALIDAAGRLTDADPAGDTVKTINVISDFQEGTSLTALGGFNWPADVRVNFLPIRARPGANAALHWAGTQEDLSPASRGPKPRIAVANASDSTRDQFQVHRHDPAGGSTNLTVYAPAGQRRVVELSWPATPTGSSQLQLRGDDAAFDNTLHVAWTVPPRAVIGFVGEDRAEDPAGLLFFLQRAFPADGHQPALVQLYRPSEAPPVLTPAPGRLWIVSDALPVSWSEAVESLLRQGCTVLQVLRTPNAGATLTRLGGGQIPAVTEASVTNFALLGQVDFQHPWLAPFREARYADFTPIHFWRHRALDLSTLPSARVLARFDNAWPAWIEFPRPDGRFLVMTSGWNREDSQLALSSKFVPMLYSLLDLAGSLPPAARHFYVGNAVDLAALISGSARRPARVKAPDGDITTLPSDSTVYNGAETPGVYAVVSEDPPVLFAVNLDPAESRTAPLSLDLLEKAGVPRPIGAAALAQRPASVQMGSVELEGQQRLWRGLVLAALLLLLTETWLAGWLSRRSLPLTTSPP